MPLFLSGGEIDITIRRVLPLGFKLDRKEVENTPEPVLFFCHLPLATHPALLITCHTLVFWMGLQR